MISEAAVIDALRAVRDASLERDIISLKFVKDLAIKGGRVTFTLETATAARSPAKDLLAKQAGDAVAKLPGVTAVDVNMAFKIRPVLGSDFTKQPVPGVKNVIGWALALAIAFAFGTLVGHLGTQARARRHLRVVRGGRT